MRNHLVIGLGGTGGRVIRSLRKRVFQEYRRHTIDGVGLQFLYVDSSDEMMSPMDSTWKTLGTSVQLPRGSQFEIKDTNLRKILSSRRDYPNIDGWIGSNDYWEKVPSDIITSGIGSQRRRLGRLLFGCKSREFRQALARQIGLLTKQTSRSNVAYHVVTGLAGGTGSGAVLDVLAQICSHVRTPQNDPLVLYAVLPDRMPRRNWDAGYYHANGYAALLELNAAMIGRYKPWDVVEGKGRLEIGDKLKCVYLITNENADDVTVDIESELSEIISDFLYEKIAESRSAESPTLSAENFTGDPEIVPGTNPPEQLRSRKFASFGIKRVAIPEEEITEYLTTSFTRQAVLQLYYNNWSDTRGFLEEPRATNYLQIASSKDNQKNWLLTDHHLMLVLPILPQDVDAARNKYWSESIETEWVSYASHIMPQCADLPREDKLNQLQVQFEEEFARNYRGEGVSQFYKIRREARQEMARHIIGIIEQELFGKWQDGTYSASEIAEILAALRMHLDDRKRAFTEWQVDINQEVLNYTRDLEDVLASWARLGLATYFMQWRRHFDSYGNACRDLHRARTEAQACEFACGLIPQITTALSELATTINTIDQKFGEALDEYKKALEARLVEKEARDFARSVVKFYDPSGVKKVVKLLVTNESEQRRQTDAVRRALINTDTLGDAPTFAKFLKNVASADLRDIIERECLAQVQIAHETLIKNERDRVLGVSLMARLRGELGGSEEKLTEFARNLITRAKVFARFDPAEVGRSRESVGAVHSGEDSLPVILVKRPRQEEFKDFVDKLDSALTTYDNAVEEPKDNPDRPREISVIAIDRNFPARFLEILHLLKEKYEACLKSRQGELNQFVLHTEDKDKLDLPDLYPAVGAPMQSLSYLMIAEQLGILKEEVDANRRTIVAAYVGKGVHEDVLQLGDAIDKAVDHLDHRGFVLIKTEIDHRLEKEFSDLGDKQALFMKIEEKLERLKKGLKGGAHNAEFPKYREAALQAVKIIGVE